MSEPADSDEIDGGGAAPPKPGAPRTSLGPVAVATGNENRVALPARYLLVITVRDRAGSPLERATVTVLVDGRPQKLRETDATGLVDPPIEVAPQQTVEVRADFPPYPSDAEPPLGKLDHETATRELPVAALAARARPLAEGSPPWWPEAKGAAGAVYLTLRPVCRYRPRHLFPWQNKILRSLVYRTPPDGPMDAGRARSGGVNEEGDTRDRKQRLRDFIRHYRGRIPGAESITEFLRRSRGEGDVSPELNALKEQVASARALQRRIRRIDLRMDWLKYKHGRGNWGAYVIGDPGAPPPPPPESAPIEPDVSEIPPERDDDLPAEEPPVDPAADAGAGEAEIDVSRPIQEHRALRKRRQALLKEARIAGLEQAKIDAAEALELKHRELLEYICSLFDLDADRRIVPDWVRYAVLHFSGLRYAGAHHSYQPAEQMVHALRLAEIQQGRAEPTSDPKRLAILLEEHLALVQDDPQLEESLFAAEKRRRTAAALAGRREAVIEPRVELEAALTSLRSGGDAPAPSKKAPPQAPPDAVLLDAVRGCAEHWIREMDSEEQSRLALSPPAGKEQSAPPLPLEEAWGLLIRYRDTGKLPPEAWPAVVQYTELRNDFVNVAAIAFPKPRPPKKGEPPAVPADPPAPAGGSRWPVLAPSHEGRAQKEYPSPALAPLFPKSMAAWKTQQAQNLSLVVSRAVCNQITEMLAAARGVSLEGGITGDAHGDMTGEGDEDLPGESLVDPHALLASLPSRTLFRPSSPDQLQRGDLIFFLTWRQIGDQSDPSSWVPLFLDMSYRVAVYGDNDPLPGTPERKPAPPAYVTLDRVGSGRPPRFLDAQTGAQVQLLEELDQDMLLRGKGARPDRLPDMTGEELRNRGAPHRRVEQLGVWRTQLGSSHRLSHVLVRRHPLLTHYSEVLAFSHIATVIEPPWGGPHLLAFETADPTGVTIRPWRAGWNVVYARPAGQRQLRHLAHYLDRENLLSEWRLPKTEDG